MIEVALDLFRKYVKGTEKGAIVQLVQALLCNLTAAVSRGIGCAGTRVYISTRVVKHAYDKRTAEEFDALITSVHLVVKYPAKIYKNKEGKRGKYCFMKEIRNKKYICLIETVEKEKTTQCEVVTFFRTDEGYLKNFELLWEWKGGNLHRSAFDSGFPQPSNTPQ